MSGAITGVAFAFGDNPRLADELLALVLAGRKTATCSAAREYPPGHPERPVVGRRDTVLDGAGRPRAVIETTEVVFRRFCDVDAAFAAAEGEGDGSLEQWRAGHAAYFGRNGGFSPDMDVICERFRLVEVLERNLTGNGC